jgi:hypothetical protein
VVELRERSVPSTSVVGNQTRKLSPSRPNHPNICHPERSGLVREAKQTVESKDPFTAGAEMDLQGAPTIPSAP